jgi:signal transduction histidine kinase
MPPRPLPDPGASLRARFAIFGAAVAIATSAILGSYQVWAAWKNLRAQALRDQLVLAKSLASRVDQGVSQAYQAVAALAERREAVNLETSPLDRDLGLVTRHIELLDALVVVDRSGHRVAHSQPWWPEILPPQEMFLKDLGRLRGISYTAVLTDLYRTPDGEEAVCIRAPVIRAGTLVGVAAGVLQLPRHGIGTLEGARIGAAGHAYLVSEDGEPLLQAFGNHSQEDRLDHARLAPLMTSTEGVQEFKAVNGKTVLAAWARLPLSGWTVVVRQPAADVFAPAARMLRSMSLFTVIATLAAVVAALAAARRVAAPIERLTQRVAKLDPDRHPMAERSGGDELGRLSQALDEMTLRLQLRRRQRDAAHRRALAAERKLAENARLTSLGELAAGLAHELNNPLTVIQGAAQVLPGSNPEEAVRWSGEILRETGRCRRLVNDLLNLARPGQVLVESVSLRGLCRETWEHARMRDRGRSKLRLPDRDMTVRADPSRLKQVLGNLMRNALETRPRSQVVSVGWSRHGNRVRLEVTDQGPGPGPDPEALFKPFYTTKAKGTGLGLAIARAQLRAHRGHLWAKTAPSGGACFVAEWPGTVPQRSKEQVL